VSFTWTAVAITEDEHQVCYNILFSKQ